MNDPSGQAPPATELPHAICVCGASMHAGIFGIDECDECGTVHAAEHIILTQEPAPTVIWHETDAYYALGLVDRWIELDLFASLSVMTRPLVVTAKALSGWATLAGALLLFLALLAFMMKDGPTTRAYIGYAFAFVLFAFSSWLLSIVLQQHSYRQ